MESLTSIMLALAPDLAIIAVGVVVARWLEPAAWRSLDKLNYCVLFPALLFHAASGRGGAPDSVLFLAFGVWAVMALCVLAGRLARRAGPASGLEFASLWQTSWRFNTALAFVAVGATPGELAPLMAVAVGFGIPASNFLAALALSRGGEGGLRRALINALLNPFFLASLAGLISCLTDVHPPAPAAALISRLADAALPLTLLSLGAALDLGALRRMTAVAWRLHAVKLLLAPAIVLLIAWATGAHGPAIATLLVFAALPTSSAAHVIAAQFGADPRPAATLIAQSNVIGCASLPFWLLAAEHLAR